MGRELRPQGADDRAHEEQPDDRKARDDQVELDRAFVEQVVRGMATQFI